MSHKGLGRHEIGKESKVAIRSIFIKYLVTEQFHVSYIWPYIEYYYIMALFQKFGF